MLKLLNVDSTAICMSVLHRHLESLVLFRQEAQSGLSVHLKFIQAALRSNGPVDGFLYMVIWLHPKSRDSNPEVINHGC